MASKICHYNTSKNSIAPIISLIFDQIEHLTIYSLYYRAAPELQCRAWGCTVTCYQWGECGSSGAPSTTPATEQKGPLCKYAKTKGRCKLLWQIISRLILLKKWPKPMYTIKMEWQWRGVYQMNERHSVASRTNAPNLRLQPLLQFDEWKLHPESIWHFLFDRLPHLWA